jgi:hypothetical protein
LNFLGVGEVKRRSVFGKIVYLDIQSSPKAKQIRPHYLLVLVRYSRRENPEKVGLPMTTAPRSREVLANVCRLNGSRDGSGCAVRERRNMAMTSFWTTSW